MLCAGAGVYDVARMLGDTVDTVEKHYAPFVCASACGLSWKAAAAWRHSILGCTPRAHKCNKGCFECNGLISEVTDRVLDYGVISKTVPQPH